MDVQRESRGDFYRQLLVHSRVFLTELDQQTSTSRSHSPTMRRAQSVSPPMQRVPSAASTTDGDELLMAMRQQCQQRLLACSRRKLRLLALQEQVNTSDENGTRQRQSRSHSSFVVRLIRTRSVTWDSNGSSTILTANDAQTFDDTKQS
jgi:hypothetical protein